MTDKVLQFWVEDDCDCGESAFDLLPEPLLFDDEVHKLTGATTKPEDWMEK